MKPHQKFLTKCMVLIVGSALCGVPELAQALPQQQQSTTQADQQTTPTDQQGQTVGSQPNVQNGTMVNPAQGPLQPVPTQNEPTNPSQQNPESTTEATPATPAPQPKPEPQVKQPLGAATAEGVPTVGGAASRPAGEAIAPAKQSQRRSLLIKVGLIAAAGVAGGVVYGLSKGTPSKP